ncbi:MAG: WbqC family protein [FCB group bacterium]|nr:WbqC family protein [FCB group bacterium]
MILTAHQPVYLPWLGLFHKIALADVFVSFNQVQYLPKDWNNRNRIKTSAGETMLTVPVLGQGHRDKAISEIEIKDSFWQKKHWKTIRLNYQKTPYFKNYESFFEDVYVKKEWTSLTKLNEYMLKWFRDTLGINVKLLDAGDYDFTGEKNDLVLDMCRQLEATTYIFGTLGRDYADVESFDRAGVNIIFQDYNHPHYAQLHGDFISHLSIIDLLFNCGDKSLEILMSGNLTREDIISSRI